MKIVYEYPDRPQMTLAEFGEKHDLTLRVKVYERGASASFDHAGVVVDGSLFRERGNGASVDEALADYAKCISGRILVLHADTPNRRDIPVPHLSGVGRVGT